MGIKVNKFGYLSMRGDETSIEVMETDLRELGLAARNLANHAVMLGGGVASGTTFFKFLAFMAAIYLLVLDRTNWRTNMLTSLLVPYIFISLPSSLFYLLSVNILLLVLLSYKGEVGKWIAFIAVVLRLFIPRHFPDWLEMPGSLILLLVVAPDFFAHTMRNDVVGVVICLAIACYLLQEHIRASGGFRNSFTERHGISNSFGIILLLVYPIWRLVLHFH